MKSHRSSDLSGQYTDVTDEAIEEKMQNDTLISALSKYVAPVVTDRKRVLRMAHRMYPEALMQRDLQVFQNYITTLNSDRLQDYARNPRRIHRLMAEALPDFDPTTADRYFLRIFHDVDTLSLAPSEKQILVRIAEDYRKGYSIKESDLELVLRLYRQTSEVRKKELLINLGVTFSLRFVYQQHWIDSNDLEALIDTYFPNVFSALSNEEKQKFKDSIREDTTLLISPEDIPEKLSEILSYFDQKGRRQELAKMLSSEWTMDRDSESPEAQKGDEDLVAKMTERFNSEVQQGKLDYTLHQAFIDLATPKLKDNNHQDTIGNFESFHEGAFIEYIGPDGEKRFLELVQTSKDGLPLDVYQGMETGVRMADRTGPDGTISSRREFEFSYDQLLTLLSRIGKPARVYAFSEVAEMTTTDPHITKTENKVLDTSAAEESVAADANTLLTKLNAIDPSGERYGFSEGTYFISNVEEAEKN